MCVRQFKFSTTLYMSTNAQESATSTDFGDTNKFWQVGEFRIIESRNIWESVYLIFHLTFKIILKDKPWYPQLTDEKAEV